MEKSLWLIWKEPKERRRYIIGTLTYKNNHYYFKYVNPELEEAKKVGFIEFPGFSDLNKKYESKGSLFPNITTRLLNKARPDYLQMLNTYGLDINSTSIEILEKTKGRLLTDNFEFVPAFDKNKIEFEVAGTSHRNDINEWKNLLKINDNLILEKEPNNKYDQYAIKIIYENNHKKYHIGYVPRYYAKDLTEMLNKNIEYSAKIESLNFKSDFHDEDITASVKLIFNVS